MLGKIIVGIAATIIAAEVVEVSIKYKAWRYWDKALQEIPWPVK
tara:strand:+ start:81 stop:212 length:132 start_codon:yes stop_codon:yes gene_type:complete